MKHLPAGLAVRLSAVMGFLGVALGAFGAHLLKAKLTREQATNLWETGVLYHLVHAVVLLVVASCQPLPRMVWSSFFLGIICFSGSLYLYALTKIMWLNFLTPLGGLLLLAGWLGLAVRPASPRESSSAAL